MRADTTRDRAAESWGVQPGRFFHESRHLQILSPSALGELAAHHDLPLRLWSAGCSSGEDTWSLAIHADEALGSEPGGVAIVATDGDPHAIARAAEAVYGDDGIGHVDDARRRRYFVRGEGPRRGLWRVVASLRDCVEFSVLDLLGPWPEAPRFDAIACHAPIHALAPPAAIQLVRRFADALVPGGWLLLAAPPALPDLTQLGDLAPWGPAAFRKADALTSG